MNTRLDPDNREATSPTTLKLGLVVAVFGLLLWARFLLVTGHPRTAVADPAANLIQPPTATAHADHP